MPFQATVYRVMIASPSDVPEERQLLRDVIGEWTAVHSVDKRAVLLPVAWESHAAPQMGDRPQAIINRQLLKDCDLLVAFFGTRIGSPSGAAVSGTVEEIDEHIQSGKPAMIYFSRVAVRPDRLDPAQYAAVEEFKKRCQDRGLYETYESHVELREKLTRQLAATMIRILADSGPSGPLIAQDFVLGDPTSTSLSDAGQALLRGALADGVVMRVRSMGGTEVQAGDKCFNKPGDARDTARWEAAVEELRDARLIEQTDTKGEVYRVTHRGFERADRIR
jgi:hypothetical protein